VSKGGFVGAYTVVSNFDSFGTFICLDTRCAIAATLIKFISE